MRVNKREMARRIQLCLSSLKCGSMDSEEQVDRIIHYFARLHGVGVASEETEKDIRYVFVRYQHDNIRETDGDNYVTFDVYADISLSRIWYERYVSKTAVEDMLYYIERDLLKITSHWEEYLREDASSYGFGGYTMIVDDLVPEKVKKHADSLDAMTYSMSFPRNCGKTNLITRAMEEYAKRDVEATLNAYKHMLNSIYGTSAFNNGLLDISDVIFNDPATIVLWRDGSKTVVKAQDGETYDPEKGLAMAICKKTMGNTRDYYITFKKHLKKWKKEHPSLPEDLTELVYTCAELDRLADRFRLVMSVVGEFEIEGEKYRQYSFSNGEDSHITSYPEKITRGELFELYKRLEYLRK